MPDTSSCINLGLFEYTYDDYYDYFVDVSNELQFDMLYYDDASGTQVLYDCIDTAKATTLMAYAESEYGILLQTRIQDQILSYLENAHFDLLFVLSGLTTLTSAIKSEAMEAVDKQLETFDFDTLFALDTSTC